MAAPFYVNGTPVNPDDRRGTGIEFGTGTDTGFSVFSGPGQENVPDAAGSFNPFFSQEDRHPAFTASVDPFRKAMEASAELAGKNPAYADLYQSHRAKLDRAKRLYDIGYSTGLNDRNANDAWQLATAALGGLRPGDLDEDSFLDQHVGYLAREALQRGQNVRALGPAQARMDGAFRNGFGSVLGSLDSDVQSRFAQTEGQLRLASLALKQGLQEWEGPDANGLRSDDMRELVMRKAGEYYARCLVQPGLSSLVAKPGKLVEMAAEAVGAKPGVRGENIMESFVNAVGRLGDGFISYYGDTSADALNGYGSSDKSTGKTRAYSIIERAFTDHLARNVASGKPSAWDMDDTDQLQADLVSGLSNLVPSVARTEDGVKMLSRAARAIVDSARDGGRVDLSKLASIYVDPSAPKPSPAFSYQTTKGYEDVLTAAESIAQEAIGNRDVFSRNWGFGEKKAAYTAEGLGAIASRQLAALREKYGQAWCDANPQLLKDLSQTAVEYALSANTMADKWVAGAGNVREYSDGLRDRFEALFIANELRNLGVIGRDEQFLTRNVSPRDEDLRGTGRANKSSIYGGLLERVREHLKALPQNADPRAFTAEEREQGLPQKIAILNSVANGLEKRISAGYDTGFFDTAAGSNPRILNADRLNREADELLGIRNGRFDVNAMSGFVVAQNDPRLLETVPVVNASEMGQARALQTLVNAVYSDALNPSLARRAREWATGKVAGFGNLLTPSQQKAYVDHLAPAALDAMGRVTSERFDRTGQVVDPSVWSSDETLFGEVDRLLAKPLSGIRATVDNIAALRLQQQAQREQELGQIRNQLRAEREAGE